REDEDEQAPRPAARWTAFGFRHVVHLGLVANGSGDGSVRPCTTLKNVGTNSSVDTVANNKPPITARPSGAFCSPPSPRPNAIGSMPITIASAVINTGRRRTNPASRAA